MAGVLLFKEKIKGFYGQYSNLINMGLRFLLALIVLLSINNRIGYSDLFSNIFIVLIMSILSALTNMKALAFFCAITVFANCMAVGWEIGVISVIIMLVLLIVFVIFVPEDVSAIILTPLSIMLGIPAFAAIGYGLKRTPACLAAMIPGIIMYYFIDAVEKTGSTIQAAESGEYLANIKLIADELIGNRMLIMHIVACAAVVILVYAIRRLSADYSWHIAVGVGGALYIIMCMLAGMAFDMDISIATILLGVVVSIALGYVFLLFTHHVEYSMSERLEFEDDDYYYYVKAIPKNVLTENMRKVQTISPKEEPAGEIPAEANAGVASEPGMQLNADTGVILDTQSVNLEEKLEDSLEEL